MSRQSIVHAACLLSLTAIPAAALAQAPALELRKGDRVVFVGNTLAERLQLDNHFETLLQTREAGLQLVVRNLGWSGDTITLQPRPLNFADAATHLRGLKADVVLCFFGANESFAGEAGVAQFERDLDAYLAAHLAARYNGQSAPRVALVSPIAHERLARLPGVDVEARNRELARYTDAMRRAAAVRQVMFVDLFTPTRKAMDQAAAPLTINGIHLNDAGGRVVARLLMAGLGLGVDSMTEASAAQTRSLESLRELVRDKNQQFFYRWRPLNAEYVVGRRVDPFGSVNFPPEMKTLDDMVADRDRQIWKQAAALRGVRYAEPPVPSPAGGGSR
jgi:lysophospholipase L1-like esterase